jgi:hypothetical protein
VTAVAAPTRTTRVPWAGVANLLTAVGNTVSIFAVSVAASDAEAFGVYAASLAALVFAFGLTRAILGETLTLQAKVQLGAGQYVLASALVAAVLGAVAAVILSASSTTRPLGLLTGMVIFCFLVNDAARHWAFRCARDQLVALTDAVWLVAAVLLYLMALAGWLGPRTIYGTWALIGLSLAVPLLWVRPVNERPGRQSALAWLATSRALSLRLAAEAAAASAAVTVPLAAAAILDMPGHEGGAIRLLQAFFGFQQIIFFSALVTLGRGADASARRSVWAGSALAAGGVVMSVLVGLVVALTPTSWLVAALGDASAEAKSSIWSFSALHMLISVSNGGLLSLRISGRAAVATVPRVIGALTGTVLATALMPRGVVGYSVGSAVGIGLFTLLVAPEIWRPPTAARVVS